MTTITCDHEGFCPTSLVVMPGEMLTDAIRRSQWQHKRLPMGKVKNYCPKHKVA